MKRGDLMTKPAKPRENNTNHIEAKLMNIFKRR